MAAYTQAYANCSIDDDTRFQTWVTFISNSLTSIGWAKTADTGQIVPASVTAPVAIDTSAGYEIRQSDDAFDDIYLKIEYGSGPTVGYKAFWVTMGTGSDGSGGITGEFFARVHCESQVGLGDGAGDDFVSGDGSTIRIACTTDSNDLYSLGIFISRSHDHSGTNDDEMLWVWWQGYNNQIRTWLRSPKGAMAAATIAIGSVRHSDASGDASNNPVYPVLSVNPLYGYVTNKHYKVGWVSLFTHQAQYTIDGVTYVNVFGSNGANNWVAATPADMCLLMRYE